MAFSSYTLKKILSFIWPQRLASAQSEHSGELEVSLEHGRVLLNTKHANYSYGSLQQVFEIAFRKLPLQSQGISRILILGMGGGCLVPVLRKLSVSGKVTAIEIDPVVIDLAHKHFPDAFENVELVQADALEFIRTDSGQYDLILVDLFLDRQVVPRALSEEFIASLKERLCTQGYVYQNLMLDPPDLSRLELLYLKYFNDVSLLKIMALNQVIVAGN